MSRENVIKFYEEVKNSENLKREFVNLRNQVESGKETREDILAEKIVSLAKENGYDFTEKELFSYMGERTESLSDEDLLNVSGGLSLKAAGVGFLGALMLTLAGGAMVSSSAYTVEDYSEKIANVSVENPWEASPYWKVNVTTKDCEEIDVENEQDRSNLNEAIKERLEKEGRNKSWFYGDFSQDKLKNLKIDGESYEDYVNGKIKENKEKIGKIGKISIKKTEIAEDKLTIYLSSDRQGFTNGDIVAIATVQGKIKDGDLSKVKKVQIKHKGGYSSGSLNHGEVKSKIEFFRNANKGVGNTNVGSSTDKKNNQENKNIEYKSQTWQQNNTWNFVRNYSSSDLEFKIGVNTYKIGKIWTDKNNGFNWRVEIVKVSVNDPLQIISMQDMNTVLKMLGLNTSQNNVNITLFGTSGLTISDNAAPQSITYQANDWLPVADYSQNNLTLYAQNGGNLYRIVNLWQRNKFADLGVGIVKVSGNNSQEVISKDWLVYMLKYYKIIGQNDNINRNYTIFGDSGLTLAPSSNAVTLQQETNKTQTEQQKKEKSTKAKKAEEFINNITDVDISSALGYGLDVTVSKNAKDIDTVEILAAITKTLGYTRIDNKDVDGDETVIGFYNGSEYKECYDVIRIRIPGKILNEIRVKALKKGDVVKKVNELLQEIDIDANSIVKNKMNDTIKKNNEEINKLEKKMNEISNIKNVEFEGTKIKITIDEKVRSYGAGKLVALALEKADESYSKDDHVSYELYNESGKVITKETNLDKSDIKLIEECKKNRKETQKKISGLKDQNKDLEKRIKKVLED